MSQPPLRYGGLHLMMRHAEVHTAVNDLPTLTGRLSLPPCVRACLCLQVVMRCSEASVLQLALPLLYRFPFATMLHNAVLSLVLGVISSGDEMLMMQVQQQAGAASLPLSLPLCLSFVISPTLPTIGFSSMPSSVQSAIGLHACHCACHAGCALPL